MFFADSCQFANCVTIMFILCGVTTHVEPVFYFDRSPNPFVIHSLDSFFFLLLDKVLNGACLFTDNFVKFIIKRRKYFINIISSSCNNFIPTNLN